MEVGARCDSNAARRALMSFVDDVKASRRPRILVIMAASPSMVVGVGFLPLSPGIADTRLLWALLGLQIVREGEGGGGGRRRATVPAVLQYSGYCSQIGSWRWLGLQGRWKRRPRGFAHGRQERRDFLLISSLIRLIHLLSLYREVYLTPKQATNKP